MKAAREVGIDGVPVVVKEYESREEEIYALVMDNANQRERTPPQKWREAQAIEDVVGKWKEENTTANLPTVDGSTNRANLRDWADGKTADIVGREIGIGGERTYQKLNNVMEAAEDGDETVQEQVVELESRDQSIHGAYTTVRDAQKEGEGENEPDPDTSDDFEEESDSDTSDEVEEESSEEDDGSEQDVEESSDQTQQEVEETTTESGESEETTETETSPTKTPWDDETFPLYLPRIQFFVSVFFDSPTTSLIDFAISFLCSLFPHSPQMN